MKRKLGDKLDDDVIDIALTWLGRDFAPGRTEQCAMFVRHCFKKFRIDLPSTAHPTDLHLLPNMPLGPGYANSLAGDEVGQRLDRADIRRGDLVFFRNTYGNFPVGVITHVGLAIDNQTMIDRSTSSKPVRARLIDDTFPGLFVEGRRVVEETKRWKLYHHHGRTEIIDCGKPVAAVELKLWAHDAEISMTLNDRPIKAKSIIIEVVY